MPKERCEEQAKLALSAVAATNRVYDAKNELDAAKKQKLDTGAIAAVESHKKQHKCWGIGLPRQAS
jgi:hypothetical protein